VSDESLPTRSSLLARVRDLRDQTAWSEFAALYTPLIERYLRNHRLQDADAADVAQETLRKIMAGISRLEYNRNRGKFRSWLLTVTRNALIDHVKRAKKLPAGSGDTAVHALLDAVPAASAEDEAQWDEAFQQRLLQWAMEQVSAAFEPRTWQAFYETAIRHRSPEDVAAELSMTVGAVYVAKSRVTARLRRVVAELEDEG
jgi:RNA polymerase sigma-70 factor (ECF subfamily)